MEKKDSLEIIIVRHAETQYNNAGDRDGCDGDLTELGEKQCIELGKRLKNLDIDAYITSPLLRAFKTAVGVCNAKPDNPILQIMPEIIECGVPVGYYGCSEEYLKKYCVDKNIRNVTFTGMQLNPYSYMRKADLFVLSSLREGFALVIPEAMACGLPVLSTSCTGPVEILKNGEYGMLVDNNDENIYYGLKNVLDNPEQLDYFREKSAERYKDFDEKIIIKKLINIFEITKDE